MMDRFQGDPAVKITEGGASMTFKGGQPVMDQGFENAVQMSLFTKPGWWGNVLLTEDEQKIGSNFEQIRTIVDVQTINDYADDARVAMRWMISSRLAESIDVTVLNPYLNQIHTSVIIRPPGRDSAKLLFLKNGINWIMQATYPANERL
jgi:phage gp46-like protein